MDNNTKFTTQDLLKNSKFEEKQRSLSKDN